MADLKFIGVNFPGLPVRREAAPATDRLLVDILGPSGGASGPLTISPVAPVTGTNLVLDVRTAVGTSALTVNGNGTTTVTRPWTNGTAHSWVNAFSLDPANAPSFGADGSVQIVLGSGVDPTTGAGTNGSANPAVGSLMLQTNGTAWVKTGASATAWTQLGSGGSLQDAYDIGPDITQTLQGIEITGGGSMLDTFVLRVVGSGTAPNRVFQVERSPLTPAGGAGIEVIMGANATGRGVHLLVNGNGTGQLITTSGSGVGMIVDTSGGTGHGIVSGVAAGASPIISTIDGNNAFIVDGSTMIMDVGDVSAPLDIVTYATINVLAATGDNPIQTSINGNNALTVDATGSVVDIGTTSVPIDIVGYRMARMGSAAGATLKSLQAFTTDGGTSAGATNKLLKLLAREGVNAAGTNVAELAISAGSAGETLLTKAGRLYAQNTLVERAIQNGVTLAAGEVVAVSATSARINKADAGTAANIIGICLVGGTGNVGGTVFGLVAMNGATISGLSGLTANAPVYLSDTTAGLVTSAPPTDPTKYHVQIGYALTTSDMVVMVMPKSPPPLAIRAVSANTTLTDTDEVLKVNSSGGARDVQLPAVVLNQPRSWVIKKEGGGTNTITLVRAASETIEGVAANLVLPDSDSAAAVGPSWTLVRDAAGNYTVL